MSYWNIEQSWSSRTYSFEIIQTFLLLAGFTQSCHYWLCLSFDRKHPYVNIGMYFRKVIALQTVTETASFPTYYYSQGPTWMKKADSCIRNNVCIQMYTTTLTKKSENGKVNVQQIVRGSCLFVKTCYGSG